MDIDLDGMSLEDLRALRARLDRAIESYEGRRKREALAAAEQAAKQFGFNLADLTGVRAGRGGRRAAAQAGAPKYAHPDDASQTWSGRGRRPRWVAEQLESGRSLEELAI